MNAPVRFNLGDPGARINVVVDTRTRSVTANGKVSLGWDGDQLVMLALLARAFPSPVRRDKIMSKVFAGRRAQKDPASCLRALFQRARAKLRPLGVDITYTPHPEGSDLPGFYMLGPYQPDRCPLIRGRV